MSIISDELPPLFQTTNQNYILSLIQEEDGNSRESDEGQSLFKSISMWLSRQEDRLEINNAIASGLLSFLFILTTYGFDSGNSVVIWWIEMIINIDLCLDWILFLILAENRLSYLFKPQSLISYLTITASFYCLLSEHIEFIDTYELKFMKVIRILSISRVEEVLKRRNMPLGRAIFRLVFESIAIIFIFASGMLRIENRYDRGPLIEE